MINATAIKEKLYKKSNVCALCGKDILTSEVANIDHILPKSKGGTNVLANLQIVHASCNIEKGNKMTKQCKEKALEVYPHLEDRINKIKDIQVVYNEKGKFSFKMEPKGVNKVSKAKAKQQQKSKYNRVVTTTFTPCTAPMDLYNEFARNGMQNLSYNRILEYFEAYKNYNGYKVEIKEK